MNRADGETSVKMQRYLGGGCLPHRLMHGVITAVSLLFYSEVLAGTYALALKVRVMENTCVINDNKAIDVVLSDAMDGDVLTISRIDGIAYGKTAIPYTLQCYNAAENPKLKLKFTGTPAGFNSAYMGTSEGNLGLRFMAGENSWAFDTWMPFNYDSAPLLWVIPVASGSGGIDAGTFTASGTLSVEYE